MTELAIAVADLARFCHRSGDIDHRFSPSPTGAQGIAGHQRLYARRPASYSSEYPVEYLHREPGLRLTLRGRADGYDSRQGLVEEIKTCRVEPQAIPEAVAQLHLAQGRLYAAMIADHDKLQQLTVQVTWLNIDNDSEYSLSQQYSSLELADFLADTLARFSGWLHLLQQLRSARDTSLQALGFPFGDFRRGQRHIAELSYKCVDQGGQLLLEAPTGIGKTAAVLFPALKALATGKHEKIVFVTAKSVGRRTAEDTLAMFTAAGYRGNALSLTARDKICLSPGRACHGEDCPYAQDYYDKLPAAMTAAMAVGTLRRTDIETLAREHEVCPYELAQDLVPWVDVIIGDVHYVYSLTASLGHAMENGKQRWSVLLDEAHNLPGRARGMYSAGLGKAALMQARKQVAGAPARALARLNRQFLELQKEPWQETDFHRRDSLPPGLQRTLQDFIAATAEELAEQPAYLQQHPVFMDFYFDALQFLRVAEQWGEDYRLELSRGAGKQSLYLALNCLDPSRLLAERQRRAHAVIAFSATLSPMPWSRASLGLAEDTVCSRSDSPFGPGQLQVSLATDIDTRYRQREASGPALARRLRQWLAQTPGNCIIYFPSYRYLQDVLAHLQSTDDASSRTIWAQQREQDDARRDALLQLLSERSDVAAFCILGGVFGEGIDLPGNLLDSVVVVGVGMPQVNRDTRELQQWFGQRYGAGFEYTFLYPGMQKVDQALGRVVRRMEDAGSALLIDPRYGQKQYRELLPPWWEYLPWRE